MAAMHYAAMYYPAKVLGDRELWPKLRDDLIAYYESGGEEDTLIAQWLPCVTFDQTGTLPGCRVPTHVIAFEQDVQAVPQDNMEVAHLPATATTTSSPAWATARSTATRRTSSTRSSRSSSSGTSRTGGREGQRTWPETKTRYEPQ